MKRLLLLLSVLFTAATIAGAQTITTSPIPATSFCPGDTFSVGFTATGTYTPGNIFNAQLSDAVGSFATPTIIGSVTSTTSGSVHFTIPIGTPTGLGYRIRVSATLPVVNGIDNGSDIGVGTQAASGTISGPTSLCAGATGTYSVTAANGATSYTWTLPAGFGGTSTTNTITVTAGAASGTIAVAANGSCGVSSAQQKIVTVINTPAQPSAIAGSSSVCNNATAAYSVTPGPNVTSYTWTLPATWTGSSTTASINATAGPASGTITVTASNACGTSAASSKAIGVIPNVVPAAFITSTAAGTICGTKPVTFTASVFNEGPTPGYQWQVNGVNVGTPSLTYTAPGGADGDIITFDLTSSATCALPATVTSNAVTLTVAPGVVASTTPATVCRGGSLQFAATTVPNSTYTWTGPNYTTTQQNPRISTIFNSGYYVVEAVSAFCTTRDSVLITVNPIPELTVSLNGGILSATPGFASYVWALNGNVIPGAITADYTPTAPGNYVVRGTSAAGCTGSSAIYTYSTTGILTLLNESGISMYPNPALSELHVTQTQVNAAVAAVYNSVGQMVLTNSSIVRNEDARLDLSTLPSGIYVLTLRDANNGNVITTKNFVKQ